MEQPGFESYSGQFADYPVGAVFALRGAALYYLEATQNKLPILARVIVAYENRIAMAQTLTQALQVVFKGKNTPVPPPIVRSVDEAIAP